MALYVEKRGRIPLCGRLSSCRRLKLFEIAAALTVCVPWTAPWIIAPALADDSVKEAIFEDCDSAKQLFVALKNDEDQELYPYFVRVLALNTQAPGVPEAFAQLPGSTKSAADPSITGNVKGTDLGPRLWQSVDAKRELRAKRCVLDLFAMGGSRAAGVLDELAAVYGEQNLSDEIGVQIEEVSATIAERAHLKGFTPSEAAINEIISQLASNHPLVARNLFGEFPSEFYPRFLRALAAAQIDERQKLLHGVLEAGQHPRDLLPGLLSSAANLTPAEVEQLIGLLELSPAEIPEDLLNPIAVLAANSAREVAQPFAKLLGRICLVKRSLPLNDEAEQLLAKAGPLLSEDFLDGAVQRCLVDTIPAIAQRVPFLIFPSEPEALTEALALLPGAIPHLDDEERAKTYSQLKQIAVTKDLSSAEAATRLLALFPGKRSETLMLYTNLIKPLALSKDPERAEVVSRAVIAGLITLGPGKDLDPFVPFLLSTLMTFGMPEQIRSLLPANDSKIESQLLEKLEKGSPDDKRAVLVVLGSDRIAGKRGLKRLVDLSSDQNTGALARKALLQIGRSATAAVRAGLPKSPPAARRPGLALLEGYGTSTRTEAGELTSMLTTAGCDEMGQNAAIVTALLHREDPEPIQNRTALEAKVRDCITQVPSPAAQLWIEELTDILLAAPEKLLPLISGNAVPSSSVGATGSYLSLVQLAVRGMLAPDHSGRLIAAMLQSGDRAVKLSLLESLQQGPYPQEVIAALRSLADNQDTLQEVRSAALTALARLQVDSYDWEGWLSKLIERAGQGDDIRNAFPTLEALRGSLILAKVEPALRSNSPNLIRGAARVGAGLGARGGPLVSRLWELRTDRAPAVRYGAVLALLQIAPLTPDLGGEVQNILVNRYFGEAKLRPIRWKDAVALMDIPRERLGTLRANRIDALRNASRKNGGLKAGTFQ